MDNLYLTVFYIFKFFIKFTPKALLNIFLNLLTKFIYLCDKKHRRIVITNLNLAYENRLNKEEKENICKNCYKNLVYSLADFVRNQGASKEDILSKVKFENEHYLKKALEEKEKIILLTGHYGNWELLSLSIAAKFTNLSIVGRNLDSKAMNTILEANRKQFGIELLSKKGAMKGMVNALKSNIPVGILVDQNTSDGDGILINFFGKKARHTPVAAILAKKFNAKIIPVFITNKDFKSYKVTFYKPIHINNSEDKEKDIKECVQKQASITQKIIEQKPEEWFWLHKRWKNQYRSLYE